MVPAGADEAKPTAEDRATMKWVQSPDVPCLLPSPPKDSLLCEKINLLTVKLGESRFSATCCQHVLIQEPNNKSTPAVPFAWRELLLEFAW